MKVKKICHISDTHDVSRDLNKLVPENVDILFFTGDLTYHGREWELNKLLEHMKKLSNRIEHVVGTLGNHELGAQGKEKEWKDKFKDYGVILLDHEAIEIEGIKVFGSPWTPWFFDWAYNYTNPTMGIQGETEIAGTDMWKDIPENTKVLLTHGPPQGKLDLCRNGRVGCAELMCRIEQLNNLKYHMFGHIHEGYGTLVENGVTYSNGSIMDGRYRFVNKPNLFDLIIEE